MYQLRDYQSNAVSAVVASLKEKLSNKPAIELPTGAGKSLVIAELVRVLSEQYKIKVLVLAHRQELLEQNAEELKNLGLDVSIYSAGLKKKEIGQITVAGIQSVYKKAEELGSINLVLVDEAHLINADDASMYQTLLNELIARNGKTRIVGLTATPYRLKGGLICGENKTFTKIVYRKSYGELLDEKYLAPIRHYEPAHSVDTSNISIRGGEFVTSESETAFMQVVATQCAEMQKYSEDRKKLLIFCSSVRHVQAIGEELARIGVTNHAIAGKVDKTRRAEIIEDFKEGKVRALVNCDIFTTGFNVRDVDCIVLLRPTQSLSLYVQMLGRGTRLAEGKTDCLLLDFGENVQRFGRLDEITYSDSKKVQEESKKAQKKCTSCLCINKLGALLCENCGADFFKACQCCGRKYTLTEAHQLIDCLHCKEPLILRQLGNARLDSGNIAQWEDVKDWSFRVHKKFGSPDSICINIQLKGRLSFDTYLCFFHHQAYARHNAFKIIAPLVKDARTIDALKKIQNSYALLKYLNVVLRKPDRILVEPGKWPKILKFYFADGDEIRKVA